MSDKQRAVGGTNPIHWKLIDQIYETGQSPEAWPVLLDSLFTSFRMSESQGKHDTGTIKASLQVLLTHFERALKLNQHIDRAISETVAGQNLDFPYPIVVVDGNLEIVYRNTTGHLLFPPQSGIRVENRKISVSNKHVAEVLTEILGKPAIGQETQATVLLQQQSKPGKSLIAITLRNSSGHRLVVLAWLDLIDHERLSAGHFRQLYGLTETESRVLRFMLRGAETVEIAKQLSIQPETVRAHSKNMYRKTGTNRKAELVQSVMCGPAFLSQFLAPRADMFVDTDEARSRRDQSMTLRDGRRLGFAEYGSPHGRPVLLIHNMIGSRMQLPTSEQNLIAQNIRLIVPDRPGFGLSTLTQHKSMQAWSQDIVELVDHLRIGRFYLVGSSLGAVYGLGLARHIPERIDRFAMVSCIPEISHPKLARELMPSTRRLLFLARHAPAALDFILKSIIRKGPDAYLDKLVCDLPEVDMQLYRDPAFHRMMVCAVAESLRQGSSSLLQDIQIMNSPWGIHPESITVPVHCWHGGDDALAPHHLIKDFAEKIQQSQFNLLEDETHWLLFRQWNTIIARLIS